MGLDGIEKLFGFAGCGDGIDFLNAAHTVVAFWFWLIALFLSPVLRAHSLDVTGQTFLTPDLLNTSQGRFDATHAGVMVQLNFQAPLPVLLSLAWRPIEPTIQTYVVGCNKLKERCL